jgi:cyclopropane fatty-acyl-phospholipid synthase-like methyltransferase
MDLMREFASIARTRQSAVSLIFAAGAAMMKGSGWAEFFDAEAPAYLQYPFTSATLKEVDFLIRECGIPPGSAVLDIGCGTGRHAVELARRGCDVTGVDISPGMLEQARQAAEDARVSLDLRCCDATVFEPDRSFDAAICLCEGAFGLLGAGDDPIGQPLAILHVVHAALRPGGCAVFTVLNACSMLRRHTQTNVTAHIFDPLTMAEVSECDPAETFEAAQLRERAFVPTELRLLFGIAGLEVRHIWGGTAGNWGRRELDLDEVEIMVVARKPASADWHAFPNG